MASGKSCEKKPKEVSHDQISDEVLDAIEDLIPPELMRAMLHELALNGIENFQVSKDNILGFLVESFSESQPELDKEVLDRLAHVILTICTRRLDSIKEEYDRRQGVV